MKPNATNHNRDPDYLNALCDRIRAADPSLATKEAIATRIGVGYRPLRQWTSPGTRPSAMPYTVQFALEVLARDDATTED